MADTQKTTQKKQYRQFEGEVVGTSEQKTVRVLVKTMKLHPKYKKRYLESKKYPVHDETGKAKIGDIVRFRECRPLSKTKRWRLSDIVKSA